MQSLAPMLPYEIKSLDPFGPQTYQIIVLDNMRFSILDWYKGKFHYNYNNGKSLIKKPMEDFILDVYDQYCAGVIPIPESNKASDVIAQLDMRIRATGIVLTDISRGYNLFQICEEPSQEVFDSVKEAWRERNILGGKWLIL
jgi:hypothetical protein